MKKIYFSIILFLTTYCNLLGNDCASILKDEFGAIKADMARKACVVAGYEGVSIGKITNQTLYVFLQGLEEEGFFELHDIIRKFNLPPIVSNNSDSCKIKLLAMNDTFKTELLKHFPTKENVISGYWEGTNRRILCLFDELTCFYKDTTLERSCYFSSYPNGVFVSLLGSVGNKIETEVLAESGSIVDNSIQDSSVEDSSLYTFLFWILLSLNFVVIIYWLFMKKVVVKKTYKRAMRQIEVKKDLNVVDRTNSVVSSNVVIETDEINDGSLSLLEDAEVINDKVTENKQQSTVTINQQEDKSSQLECPDVNKWETGFVDFSEEYSVVGVSVQGRNHISGNVPCQDCCKYKSLGNGWGIAVTSDGAGSAKLSHEGSHLLTNSIVNWLEKVIKKQKWIENKAIPKQETWEKLCIAVFNQIALEQQQLSKQKEVDIKSFNCTAIVVVHTPLGMLVSHIGDGRAGYKDEDGCWKSLITPHKGEECNQTYFFTHGNYFSRKEFFEWG